ncbi:uncharacterized protein LOC143465177 isoform X1 [Clavelina lepadiformis]|uniref:uncharacterized protein LOC143465177 isoform X1 n=2 Tax=Clavelina lepadiformis TaxID=159417 RepID=UPI0040436EFA
MHEKLPNSKLWVILLLLLVSNVCKSRAAVSECNVKIRATTGTFTSPNYPDPPETPKKSRSLTAFPDNGGYVTCKWEIVVPRGKGIQLKFGDFDMRAPLDDCDRGEVEIFTGTGKTKSSLDKYCPGNSPATVTLSNNSGTVVFRRPSTFTGRGFLVSFIAVASGETIDDFVTCSETGQLHVDVESFSVLCPSGCATVRQNKNDGLWGNLAYRDDSRLCQSAVHAGVISDNFGGRVRVKRQPGLVLYMNNLSNNVTSQSGAISDYMITFPDREICDEKIEFKEKQLTASSFWNTTSRNKRRQEFLPRKAMFTSPKEAWSPDDPTIEQWLQVDLSSYMNITGIETKGASEPYYYTRSFKIKYSVDNITWVWYKENGRRSAKIFKGNENFFSTVRNNFVKPTIIANHIRVYPTTVTKPQYDRYALKLALNGCKLKEGTKHPAPEGHTPTPTTTTTTDTTITTTSVIKSTTSPQINDETSTTPKTIEAPNENLDILEGENANGDQERNATTGVGLVVEPPNGAKPEDGGKLEPGDLNERSIIIIAIVAALAVTSILLAALVLILVRKRKKEPKAETMVPKHPNSRTNALYTSGIDMRYLGHNNNEENRMNASIDKVGSKKSQQGIEFKNDYYKENYPNSHSSSMESSATNSRGGVTLMYDQPCHPLMNGELITRQGSTVPLRTSYTANSDGAGPSMLHSSVQGMRDGDADSFASDDDDHEYQVIPDPVDDPFIAKAPSKASGSSIGGHSKGSDTMPWQQGAVWGTAGDAWSKDPNSPIERGHITSFGSQGRSHPIQRSRPGTFPHPVHFSTNEDTTGGDPFAGPQTAPSNSTFTGPRFSQRKHNGGQSPPNPAITKATYSPPQRYSTTSSNDSSSHSPFDMTLAQRHELSAPYYSSVPEGQENSFSNGTVPHPLPSKARKPSYKFLNSNPVEPPLFSTMPGNGHVPNYDVTNEGRPNGLSHRPSRTDSLNHAKLHSGYDLLYKKNTISDGGKSSVPMATDTYNQLHINTPV